MYMSHGSSTSTVHVMLDQLRRGRAGPLLGVVDIAIMITGSCASALVMEFEEKLVPAGS